MPGWVGDIDALTNDNTTFRTVLHTAGRLQLTVMSLEPGEEIGLEMHDHLDQFIRIEAGEPTVTLGPSADKIEAKYDVADDWAMIIPGGTWHNVINTGSGPLKLYSLYSPPEHPDGAVHQTRPTPKPPRRNTITDLVVLDGGLATELEAQGHDLSSALWSARLITDDPEAIVAAHRAYFDAGAQVATTASNQAPLELITTSVQLARRARDEHGGGSVAGSVGPYGAQLADGSEYRGDYGLTVAELRCWHRPRIAALAEAGVDLLALETVPSLTEAEAVVAELAGSGLRAWLALTCVGDRTRAGEPAAEAFALVRGIDEIVAVGVNCSDPQDATELVAVAARAGAKPVVIYPNSGELWDADARRWFGDPVFAPAMVGQWIRDGAGFVGGCCRVGPEQIAALSSIAPSA